MRSEELALFYKKEIEKNFWPFWQKAYDKENGGAFTCFTNDGKELINKTKYTWSQGRFLWLCAALYELVDHGDLALEKEELKNQSIQTYAFLKDHTILPNNNILYATTAEGGMIDSEKDKSIFANAFFILGVNKFADVFQNIEAFELALIIYENVMRQVKKGSFKTEPYPIPEGYSSHSISMIFLNVSEELAETAKVFSHPKYKSLLEDSKEISRHIFENFILEDGRIIELKPEHEECSSSLLARHVNPGHAIESVWFHVHLAIQHQLSNKDEIMEKLSATTLYALEAGWDKKYGGLLRFVDREGHTLKGELSESQYEQLILDTYDTKLWWPHTEALYTTLLMYKLTGNKIFMQWYKKISSYVFKTFPNPDPDIKEWIQIRSRNGDPLDKVVALPVKDPFHILRNFILIIKLCKEPL